MELYSIEDIENMKEEEAAKIADDKKVVKGFNIYFINLHGRFGCSYLVFKNGHQIKYANDYELHHGYKVRMDGLNGLKKYYLEQIERKLFTDEEIMQPIKSYDEYNRKLTFLRDYYALQEDRVSGYRIFRTAEEEKAFDEEIKDLVYNPAGFCYMDKSKESFIKHHVELLNALKRQKADVVNNYEYQKSAFLYEMYNHEYAYNWQADWDVLSVFGKITYQRNNERLDKYFDELKFTKAQRKAYMDARSEYFSKLEVA